MSSYKQLTREERYQIHALLQAGHEKAEIALQLGRDRSTIYREVKRDLSSAKGIVKTIVAFSNTSGGTLLIGIEDDRTVSGLNNLKEDEEQLTNLISDCISPQILPEIDILSWRDRNVLRVIVYPGPSRPYFVSSIGKGDGTYVRLGSTNRKADKGVIESLIRYSLGRSFRVTIFTESTGDHQLDDMNSRIVTLLLDNPAGLSTSELAGSLGITDRAVRSRMKSMVEKELVFPVGTSPRDPRRRFVLSDSISGRS